jgi:outer membrane protein assembly factor BamE (lipoprotein component of BamABCDE complex)
MKKEQKMPFATRCQSCAIFIALLAITGCAEIQPPSPKDFLERPIGMVHLRVGMTKDQVLAEWGDPHEINNIPASQELGPRQEWVYKSSTKSPIGGGYFNRTMHLFFDGPNLVKFYEE